MDRPLTVPEAAEILNYHPNHLSRLLRDGRVQGERVGGRWVISCQEVERIKALQGLGGRLPKSAPENWDIQLLLGSWANRDTMRWTPGSSSPSSTP